MFAACLDSPTVGHTCQLQVGGVPCLKGHRTTSQAATTSAVTTCISPASHTGGSPVRLPPRRAFQLKRRHPRQCQQHVNASASEALAVLQTHPAVQDAAATLLAAVGGFSWVKLFDYLAANDVLEQKLSRKLVHMTAGPLFMLLWPLFSGEPYARYCAALVPTLNMLRLVLVGTGVVDDPNTVKAVSRENDRRELLRGPLYYVLVLVGVTLVYWRGCPSGLVAMSLMCGGDGLADIVGRRWGAAKLPYNTAKSWAGSAAMFLGGSAMALGFIALFSGLNYFPVDAPATVLAVLSIAAAATLVESLPINQRVDDNLSVPGVSALMGYFMLQGLRLQALL